MNALTVKLLVVAGAAATTALSYNFLNVRPGQTRLVTPQRTVLGTAKSGSATQTAALRALSAHDWALLDHALEQEKSGNMAVAKAEYQRLIDSKALSRNGARHAYGRLLEAEGKYGEAMEMVKPLVFQYGWEKNPTSSTSFEDAMIWDRALLKTSGPVAVQEFRDGIRLRSLDGFTLQYYNEKGLTDDEAFDYIAGEIAVGREDYKGALADWQKVVSGNPAWFQVYDSVKTVLFALKRGAEVIPMYEEWYRHADESTRKYIKAHYNLDYSRLDNEGKP